MPSKCKFFSSIKVNCRIIIIIKFFSYTKYSAALSQVRQQRALEDASKWAGIRITDRDAIPGMMLHVAFFNLFSDCIVSSYYC